MSGNEIAKVLTIAGSDSGGGAGIQADLKAFAGCGAHGMCAITAVTAQNTVSVTDVHEVPADIIIAQVRAVAGDIGVDAVKVGMLASPAVIEAVEEALDLLPGVPVVVDPVMVAESGARLLTENAVAALCEKILPRATVTTPNLAEAKVLAETDEADEKKLAQLVLGLGPRVVVVTGGHSAGGSDFFTDGERDELIQGHHYPDRSAHGSGCTHSAVLAAQLALGRDELQAARLAKQIAAEAVRNSVTQLGSGAGPVDVLAGRIQHPG